MVVEAQADGSSDSVSLWKVGYRDSDSVKVIAVSGVGKVKSNSIYLDVVVRRLEVAVCFDSKVG